MTFTTIRYAINGPAAVITLHRPERMNAFTHEMKDEVIEALDRADADNGVRAIIFTGHGDAFCAGADLSTGMETFNLVSQAKASGALDDSDPQWRDSGGVMNLRIWNCLKPVIGAVHGPAVGIGATMLLPMDIRIASTASKFAFPFAKRGIAWDGCASWFLPRLVGMPTAMEWGLTGRTFKADEALEKGLVSELHDPDALMDAAMEKAEAMASTTAPVSVAVMRQMAWRLASAESPMAAHRVESKAILHAGMGKDAAEGVIAFLEKRSPDFSLKVSGDLPPWFPFWEDETY